MIFDLDVILSTCHVGKESSSEMQLQFKTSTLTALKMYNTNTKTALQCSALCLGEPDCVYLTRNAAGNECTLYTSGSTAYDVTGVLTYGVLYKDIKVTQLHVQRLQLLNVSSWPFP